MTAGGALAPGRPRWPVTMLTGMLGSGKTTLLRHALSEPKMTGTVLLINEIGEIGIDHHLIERIDGETILLRGGCLCCAFRADLPQTLNVMRNRWLQDGTFDMQRVIVETTGLADPDPILLQLATNPLIKDDFPLSRVVVTVDAQHASDQIRRRRESQRQIAIADQVILTKSDVALPDATATVERMIRSLNPHAPVIRVIGGRLAPRDWVGTSAGRSLVGFSMCSATAHDLSEIDTLSLTAETPLGWSEFEPVLANIITEFGRALLRLKGILNVSESERPVVIHGVHHVFYPVEFLDCWPDADHRSRLVIVVESPASSRDRILDLLTAGGSAWQLAGGHPHPASPEKPLPLSGQSSQHDGVR